MGIPRNVGRRTASRRTFLLRTWDAYIRSGQRREMVPATGLDEDELACGVQFDEVYFVSVRGLPSGYARIDST